MSPNSIKGAAIRFHWALDQYPLPFEAPQDVLDELIKFLAIRGTVDRDKGLDFQIGMRSGPVDDLWHQWLMWTHHYETVCRFVLGHTIHHAPTDMAMIDPGEWLMRHTRFRKRYQDCFGFPDPKYWDDWGRIVADYARIA